MYPHSVLKSNRYQTKKLLPMKKISFLLSALPVLTCLQLSYGQTPDWSRLLQVSTYGSQNGNALTADANYVYMAGDISGPVTYEGVNYASIGRHDMLLTKISNSGTAVWTKQFNAQADGSISPSVIQVDASQNIYVAGTFTGTMTIGSSSISSGASYNAFVAKFDASGNGVWATPYLTNNLYPGTSKLVLDGTNNCYLISNSNKLLKFNAAGTMQWEQSYPDRTLHAIAVYNSDLYIGGTLQSITAFGSITLTPLIGGFNTGFLLRADLNGVYNNSLIVKGAHFLSDGSSVSDICTDNAGNLLITGGYSRELILDTVSILNTTTSYYTYIAKCNSNFVFAWAKSSTSTVGQNRQVFTYRLFTDSNNNIYEYGLTNTPFSYGSMPVNPNGGQFLVKFDAGGNATGSAALQNTAYSKVHVTPGGKVLTTGSKNYAGAVSYGNLYLSQYNSNMTPDWQKISSNCQSGVVQVNYVKHDSTGNTYIQARVTGYCNYFGTVLSSDTAKTIISKHDVFGNLLWLHQVIDISPFSYGPGITLDKDNNVLTVGLFEKSVKIGTVTLTSTNPIEGYVAKYSQGGTFLWAAKMNYDHSADIISLATDNAGNVLVTGVMAPANYLVKFDASGNLLWSKSFPLESIYFSLVSADAQNNIYMATEVHLSDATGSATIGSVTLNQTYDDGSTALIKFDPDGNALWAKTYGGIPGNGFYSDGWPVDIRTDANGDNYLLGMCPNNSVFGTTTLANPLYKTSYSPYLTKIDATGNVVWATGIYAKRYYTNYGDLLDLDKSGNIYIGGHFNDSLSISGSIYKSDGIYDFYTCKYSNSGTFQWIKTIPADTRIITGLDAFGDNILTVAGVAGKNSTLGTFPFVKKGGSTGIIATLGNIPAAINEPGSDSRLSLYPNPSHGKFYVALKNRKSKTGTVDIEISNMLGEKIRTISGVESNRLNEIDLSALPKGIYCITIHEGDKNYSEKIVIE